MADVTVRELVGWGLDESSYRPELADVIQADTRAVDIVGQRPWYTQQNPILDPQPPKAVLALSEVSRRVDLHAEMHGLQWTTGVVDLRRLLAFQRRLLLDGVRAETATPSSNDWPALTALSFGPPVGPACTLFLTNENQATLQSLNPNLQLRFTGPQTTPTIRLHGGSPFFEVAEYRGRWFLRDGYHRAYSLLCANVAYVPAVIIRARSLAELGPVQPWFFSSKILLGSHPPLVNDFLDSRFTVEYKRPRLYKTLRVTIEESLEPAVEQPSIELTLQGAIP